jgi:effector-binding domain-containing protein
MIRSLTRARAAWIACALVALAAAAEAQQTPAPTPPAVSAPAASPSVAAPAASPATATSTPAAAAPASAPSASPAAATSAPTPAPSAPTPATAPSPVAAPAPAATPAPAPSAASGDSGSMGETIDLTARPAAYLDGKAGRDEVYSAILDAIGAVRAEIDKAGLKPVDHPIAIFLEADDSGFKFRAAVPLAAAPDGKTQLSDAVKLGQTPVGKAMRFEHRGAYDDIDGTYEAITAYLDEKGVDAQDVFVEEYLNDVKSPEDPNLQVDIYVLLK